MLKKKVLLSGLLLISTLLSSAHAMRYSTQITEANVDTIKDDLDYLKSFSNKNKTNIFFQNIFKIDTFDGAKLSTWLNERLSYIVAADYDPIRDMNYSIIGKVEKSKLASPVSRNTIIGYEELYQAPDEDKAFVVMSNVGTSLYMIGLKYKYLLGTKLETYSMGVEGIVIDSPRVGIAKIGEGLFRKRFSAEQKIKYNLDEDTVKRISRGARITTYLHEARHSDGSGENLGMGHSKCPTKHDYAGHYACEDSVNGPYGINAAVNFENYANCIEESCTEIEQTYSEILLADSCSRIVQSDVTDMCKDCDDEKTQEKIARGIIKCVKAMTKKDIKELGDVLMDSNYKVTDEKFETILDAETI
jgi:hypothetical protein